MYTVHRNAAGEDKLLAMDILGESADIPRSCDIGSEVLSR
jgi:hypothetical protein